MFKPFMLIHLILVLGMAFAHAEEAVSCRGDLKSAIASKTESLWNWLKGIYVDGQLKWMAYQKGLPAYLDRNREIREAGTYAEDYINFGEMGLAEIGISVRYNETNLAAINTGRPLIIVANHHLGIADGLALQYMAGKARKKHSLLFLARWIEKLLPHAVFTDETGWGTAVPVEINLPKKSDPLFDEKMAKVKSFNSGWARKSLKVLKNGGALIIFPAGHVASINNDGRSYPENVYDAPNEWQAGFLDLARLCNADIVFANVDSVNSEAFYRDRKRFGGGDTERVIWFFSEAIGKKSQAVDVHLSKPYSLDELYDTLWQTFKKSREALEKNPALTAELMRQFTYRSSEFFPQTLDTHDSPKQVRN